MGLLDMRHGGGLRYPPNPKKNNMVVAKKKIYEIRPQQCRHLLNERIFLNKSGSKAVSASAIFADTIGPLDES